MPRRRPGVWILMLAVAIAAIALAGGMYALRLSGRATRFRIQAKTHFTKEAIDRAGLEQLTEPELWSPHWEAEDRRNRSRSMNRLPLTPGSKDLLTDWLPPQLELARETRVERLRRRKETHAKSLERRIAYEAEMRRKYEWLADHPWLRAAPDAPPPQ